MVRKTVLSALASTAVSAALVATALPAQAAVRHDPVPARQGAHWLVDQLTHGLVHNDQYGFDDYGLTADTGLELAALGGHRKAVSRIATALSSHVVGSSGYAQADEYAQDGTVVQRGYYAGATAKSLVLAEVAHRNVHTWGHTDLVKDLEARVLTGGSVTGRIADDSSFGDYANTIGQALAARGLAAAGSGKARVVTRFLLEQQCRAGYFRLNFTTDKTSAVQGCDASHGSADSDATSYAVIQLAALEHKSRAVRTAITDARSWLRHQQKASGAWGGGASTSAANANSTGLAAWALGSSAAARRGAVWVRKHQVRDVGACGGHLRHELGAVAYDQATLKAARADGITSTTRDQWRRTTTQALVALRDLPRAAGPIQVTTRHHRVTAGHRITVRVRNATPYSRVCVRIGGHHVAHAVNGAGRATVRISVPKGRLHRTLAVVDSDRRHDALRLTVRR